MVNSTIFNADYWNDAQITSFLKNWVTSQHPSPEKFASEIANQD